MRVIDLPEDMVPLYNVCLEDWSEEMKEAGGHKATWHATMKEKGLRVKLALDELGEAGGMIQYLPVERSFAEGEGLYLVLCIWVHGHKQGRGDFRRRGMGKALLQAAEEDARALGASGMAAWGILLPFWMRASWFRRQGYARADRDGIRVLLWKPFSPEARPPRWIRQRKRPQAIAGQVTVAAFRNGWCPAQNMAFERAKRAAQDVGSKVVFQEVDTSDRQVFLEWGITDGLFIDGREVRTGPPPTYLKLRRLIEQRVRHLPR